MATGFLKPGAVPSRALRPSVQKALLRDQEGLQSGSILGWRAGRRRKANPPETHPSKPRHHPDRRNSDGRGKQGRWLNQGSSWLGGGHRLRGGPESGLTLLPRRELCISPHLDKSEGHLLTDPRAFPKRPVSRSFSGGLPAPPIPGSSSADVSIQVVRVTLGATLSSEPRAGAEATPDRALTLLPARQAGGWGVRVAPSWGPPRRVGGAPPPGRTPHWPLATGGARRATRWLRPLQHLGDSRGVYRPLLHLFFRSLRNPAFTAALGC